MKPEVPSAPQNTNYSVDDKSTPMLKQYRAVKAKHQDCILFFRLGDFYEMFYEDAKLVSRVLDLTLTARGKGTENVVPMCGFPHHSADGYISRLVKSGYKVAICEQLEDPSVAKGIVKRDITRIITAGTYLDEADASARYIMAFSLNKTKAGLSFMDITNGALHTNEFPLDENRLTQIICRLPIYECVYPERDEERIRHMFNSPLLKIKNVTLSAAQDWSFNPDICRKSLCEHFQIHNLHGFGLEDKAEAVAATGALLEYLKDMNKQPLKHIDKIHLYSDDDFAFISPAAHRGLELNQWVKTIDHTHTAVGKRLFWFWCFHPLKNYDGIKTRQDAIQILKDNPSIVQRLKELLRRIPDVEKNISRLSCGYAHAKDLLSIRNTLSVIPEMIALLKTIQSQNPLFTLDDIEDLRERLVRTINEDIPLSKPEGKIICSGVNQELDELKNLQDHGHDWLRKYQETEIKRSGINTLKVGFNKVFGYYIEISKAKASLDTVPKEYIRKQTLVNGERYITPELKEYEEKILTAQDKIIKIEQEIVHALQKEILNHSLKLHDLCLQCATIDCVLSLSLLSQLPGYIKPEISEDNRLEIRDGRHPVVEQVIQGNFIANDTLLDCDENQLIILTGPNMSGKSTYIRQTAILTIMAQIGSYIPAASAHIGIVDKFFTRIGAHDDISRGQSTFMVEMNEAADILNNLTPKSLIILDEIGRGTSTYDGLSLAWALAEHLINTKTRTLFATHFHELTALGNTHASVKNYNVAVKEWKEEIIFLHKIISGSTDDSYGIYVAKLAGIPSDVILRAKNILTQLELKNNIRENLTGRLKDEEQLSLFNAVPADPIASEIKKDIEELDIDNLTPIKALEILDKFKKKIKR